MQIRTNLLIKTCKIYQMSSMQQCLKTIYKLLIFTFIFVIGTIYLLCLILTIVEPYGLRLRHMIMGCYFPKRERQRAVWLYNHIVKCRGGIVDRAKKRMQKSQFGSVNVQHVSLMGQLAAW